MAIDPQFITLVQLLIGVLSLFFLKPAYDARGTPGSRPFAVLCAGVGVYGICAGLDHFVSGYALSHFLFTVRSTGGIITTTAWLLLALEMTDRVQVTRRLQTVFAGYVVAVLLFFWTDPIHHLVVAPGSVMIGTDFAPILGAGLWTILGIGYLSTLVGTGLLVADAAQSTGIRRRQLIVLSLAILPTLAGSLATVSGATRYDYTALGYALTAVLFGWALFSGRFLDIAPVARRTALGEMSDAVVTVDDRNRVVDCNRRARELFDVDGDYAGTPAGEFFPAVVAELPSFDVAQRIETEIEIGFDDQDRHFSLSVSPVARRGQRGRVFVLRDITDRKRREQELERQNERLDQFASVVGHDLRNPLTVAAGQLTLAEMECESDAAAQHFASVKQSHERMDAMVGDLLTLARSGQRVEGKEPVELAMAVRDAWAHAEASGCELDLSIPDSVTIPADRDRLLHVFENCFRNAAEHGTASHRSQGAVDHNGAPLTVHVGLLDPTDDESAGFFVEDDGEGIPKGERDQVLEHGHTTEESGTGLGLSIVKDIVDAHGWRVQVTEGIHGGARFEVTGVAVGNQ